MQRFERMGVILRDGPADGAALEFANHLTALGVRDIRVIHVRDDFPGEPGPLPEPAPFEARVRAAFSPAAAPQIACDIRHGTGVVEILKAAREHDLGLMILGRRLPISQAGLGTRIVRIARKSPCSVLVVPELCQPHFNRVLVAVDRSEHAKLSLQTAVELAEAAGSSKMQLAAVAVRGVSPRYDLAGLTFHEAVEKQREFGERDLREFLGQFDTRNVQVESIVVLSDDVGAAITQVATARKMDLIILGSRGETRPTAVLLGSTSEQLLMTCALPVLVVKQKGETLRLLDALFEMS